MPDLKEIKKRIVSIKSTRQITKAMKLVAAAKFKKAQERILELRPYSDKMRSVLSILAKTVDAGHPLLESRPTKKAEIIALTGDRGLCGAFNTNVIRTSANLIKKLQKEDLEISVSAIGKKGTDLFKRRGFALRQSWIGLSGKITYYNAQEIAKDIIENYINKTFDEAMLVYNEFKSALVQTVTVVRLLPLSPLKPDKELQELPVEFLYEPSRQVIFDKLIPKDLEIQVFRSLLESQASEESARMIAMENATKAAGDMITSLTLQYNKARQASITSELMDIVGGVEALK